MWPNRLCQPADDGIEIFNVVDLRTIRQTETVINRRSVLVHLRGRDPVGLFLAIDDSELLAHVRSIHLSESHDNVLLSLKLSLFRRVVLGGFLQPLIDKIVKARQCPEPILSAKLIEPRDASLPVPDDVERGHVDVAPLIVYR